MKYFLKTAISICFVLILANLNLAQSQTGQFRLGIAYGSSLFSNKERFEFTIGGGQKIVLTHDNPTAYFTPKFTTGQTYSISQLSGPRTCSLFGQGRGTFASQDIVITASCGSPTLSIFKMEVTGIEQGENFKFADNYRRTYQYPFSTTANLGGYPQGDDYSLTQTAGPRQCVMTLNQGVVLNTPLTVKANCGRTGGGTTGTPAPQKAQWDLVSRSSDDKILGTFYETFTPVIGGSGADEGRYVAFVTYTKGLGGGTGKYRQIVWRDRKTGETRVVSQGMNGVEGNQNSTAPSISADGKSVAFESYATNLVPVDANGVRDVFVWNYDRNSVAAVSENRGIEANSECYEPTISGDGNLIAFSSSADNLAAGVSGTATVNVYLRDMRSGAVTLISKNEKDGKGGGGSRPSISEDGSRIAFYNYFPLTKEDKNDLWDIYVWQSGMPKLKRISKTSSGGEKDQGDESSSRVVAPSISGNGRYVAFATTATNMVSDDTNKLQDVFVVEIDSGSVIRASVGESNAQGNGDSPIGQGEKIAISDDGSLVAFSTKAKNLGGNILMKNILTNQLLRISADVESTVGQPAMSRNGKVVIFGSSRQLDSRFKSSGVFVFSTGLATP
ncbi:MAG: PD40 domain-containing protein [Pyrinomonadaceae bacterium]|nr:PD40 domain-containing protein [Pyrinomonadaceae bacterium]